MRYMISLIDWERIVGRQAYGARAKHRASGTRDHGGPPARLAAAGRRPGPGGTRPDGWRGGGSRASRARMDEQRPVPPGEHVEQRRAPAVAGLVGQRGGRQLKPDEPLVEQ